MATTSVLSGLDLTKWRPKFIREMVRQSKFEPFMGTSPTDIIHVINDAKASGYTIRVPLIARLQGNGVSGNSRLSGSEEQMDQYYQDISWEFYRNAIEISKKEREKSAVNLLEERSPLLREWGAELLKYQFIDCFHQMSNGTPYASADATARNNFITYNSDRVLFGALKSNASSGVMATALATLDTTADKLSASIIRIAKRMAMSATPRIRPYRTEDGNEFWVMFCHPLAFKALKADTTIVNNHLYALPRENGKHKNNPLFSDGDIEFDGVICKEIPEFWAPRQGEISSSNVNTNTHLVDVGDSATVDVGVNFLCGQQALGFVNKQAVTPITKKEDDYGFFDGIGIEMAHGMSKLRWNNGSGTNKDLGMVTVYTAIEPDA